MKQPFENISQEDDFFNFINGTDIFGKKNKEKNKERMKEKSGGTLNAWLFERD